MKKVILITSQFPYSGGEQFLETEVNYYRNLELTLMPKMKTEYVRKVPNGITIDTFLAENILVKNKIIYLLKSLKTKFFYKELFLEKFLNIRKFKIFLSSIYTYQMYYEVLDKYFSKVQNINNTIVYTYWNDEITYALQSLKDKYKYKLISRIHRGDLYREQKPFNYIPLKKQFTKNIDTLYTITQSANEYLEDTYGFDGEILKLARLGVDDRKIISQSSNKNSLNIVSCSFLTEVKQVDKIIMGLKIAAIKMRDVSFSWTHIGDGDLYNDLVLLAQRELEGLDNLNYGFVGNYANEKVYAFYLNNEVDVFINVSESEGVPVSIMEAMSCHIPIIAPDIGGIKDMVTNECNGFLLSNNCTTEEIVNSLTKREFFKDNNTRENSYKIFLEEYDAKKNYEEFIKCILEVRKDEDKGVINI